MRKQLCGWLAGTSGFAVVLCVLGFYSTPTTPLHGAEPPFANSVAQRDAMVSELREIKELLKEQNALLREVLKTPNNDSKR